MTVRKEGPHHAHPANGGLAAAGFFKRYPVWTASTSAGVVVAGILTALFWARGGNTPAALEQEIQAYKTAEQALAPASRHMESGARIDELQRLVNDPAFAKVPRQDQEHLRGRLHELSAYRDYETKLDHITDPKNARNEEQVQQIEKRLTELVVPPEYLVEWSQSDAYLRHREWLLDCTALKTAVADTMTGYQELLRSGRKVIETASQPNLPARAQMVLESAKQLPDPKRDQHKLIPGSQRITYTNVFEIPTVADLFGREWKELEARLKPLIVMP